MLDREHAPNDLQSLLRQLQAVAPFRSQPIVRPPIGDAVLIKQLLGIAPKALLVPKKESATQAQDLVQETHYSTEGIRNILSAEQELTRRHLESKYLDLTGSSLAVMACVVTRPTTSRR